MKRLISIASIALLFGCSNGASNETSSVMTQRGALKTIWACKVTQLNQCVLESFGDDVKLGVFVSNVDHIQPEAFVKVLATESGELKMSLGERVFSRAKNYQVSADDKAAYTVESPDVEVGYLLVVNAFNDRKATLSGYTTDLAPGQTPEDRAEQFAQLTCAK